MDAVPGPFQEGHRCERIGAHKGDETGCLIRSDQPTTGNRGQRAVQEQTVRSVIDAGCITDVRLALTETCRMHKAFRRHAYGHVEQNAVLCGIDLPECQLLHLLGAALRRIHGRVIGHIEFAAGTHGPHTTGVQGVGLAEGIRPQLRVGRINGVWIEIDRDLKVGHGQRVFILLSQVGTCRGLLYLRQCFNERIAGNRCLVSRDR